MIGKDLAHFTIIKSLGKGGMGEVFLAYDNICKRPVALKKIRDDLVKYNTIKTRFFKEARIAASLTHPSIISIFSIHEDQNVSYYTMPYIEGKTLKELIAHPDVSTQESSTSNLIRIFLNVCQAIAYCHSKGVLHRDLKPDNIILGKFGEVLILDWGLAMFVNQSDIQEEIPGTSSLTRPGKVVGTLSYVAPERILGEESTEQTDLYSLGVILYQLLTFKLPFKRTDLATSQKNISFEKLIDPSEMAPYRDISSQLVNIVTKALAPSKEMRYKHVSDMIFDLENYSAGTPEWLFSEELKIDNKACWEFQENILLAKHIAITRSTEIMEWVSLMISKSPFAGHIKIDVAIKLERSSSGIGLLLNIPPRADRKDLMDGYCLWIGSEDNSGLKLFYSNIEVIFMPDVCLKKDKSHIIQIEKKDHRLFFFLDGLLVCEYTTSSPLQGTHVGLLYKDADFTLEHFKVFIGSHNLTVSCLAPADALLASKNFTQALSEYRRIAHSFPGRFEGREAIFRAGVTLLENALFVKHPKVKKQLFSLALEEFDKLHATAGAPLEYLGKSLVYQSMHDIGEEIKCLELALRKYHQHPLLPRLSEHVIFRLHEAAKSDRLSAFHLALLTLRLLPHIFTNPENEKLLYSMQNNWEPLNFLKDNNPIIHLSFLLNKTLPLLELIENEQNVSDALFALLQLGCLQSLKENPLAQKSKEIKQALLCHTSFQQALEQKDLSQRSLNYIIQTALDAQKEKEILPLLPKECELMRIRALLSLKKWQEAGSLLDTYSIETCCNENSPLYPLYGCFLWMTEGAKIGKAHFSGCLETPYPRTTALLGYFLTKKIHLDKGWIKQALVFEKISLFRDLILFYRCLGNRAKVKFFQQKLAKEKRLGRKGFA